MKIIQKHDICHCFALLSGVNLLHQTKTKTANIMKAQIELTTGECHIVEVVRSYWHKFHVVEVIWIDGKERTLDYTKEIKKMTYLMG